jgi:hypothetical protein
MPMLSQSESKPLLRAGYLLLVLIALRIAILLIPIPISLLAGTNLLVSICFILLPVAALFTGAAYRWTMPSALLATVVGAVLQFGTAPFAKMGLIGALLATVGQSGLVVWCLGLGTCVSLLVRERNMLVPMAIFLALFDIWLVFVPEGPVGQLARANAPALTNMAYTVPRVVETPTSGHATPLGYVGPADFLFMAMFFAASHKFELRADRTAKWLGPVLVGYLLITLLAGDISVGPIRLGALPALLPIGAVVLIANAREFKLSRDERQTTVALTMICIAVLIWRFIANAQVPRSEPLNEALGSGVEESGAMPEQESASPRKVKHRRDPGRK